LLESVSLPAETGFLRQYPRQLSVGLAQRFLIAMAILHRPSLLLADEPTSALDTITQAEVLSLFSRLNREKGIAMLYVSHDLASLVTGKLEERAAVRMAGRNVGPVFEQHAHGAGFAAIHHAHQRRLPVLRFGNAGEALGKGPVERPGVA